MASKVPEVRHKLRSKFFSFHKKKKGIESRFHHHALFQEMSKLPADDVLKVLSTSVEGLSSEGAKELLRNFGPNEIAHEHHRWHKQLTATLINPFILLLAALSTVSFLTDDFEGGTIMIVMAVISVLLTFFQEYRSSRAAEKLKAMVSTNATVTRKQVVTNADDHQIWHSAKIDIPISELVVGDIVHLSAGDMIPADIRVLSSKDLFVSQSSMTGESIPIEKFATSDHTSKNDLLSIKNICFMGSNVVSGTATAVILKTGSDTYLGSLASKIAGYRAPTSFDLGINKFTWLMLRFMFVMVPLVFVINGVAKGAWSEAFMFAVAVAVGLTPEMLPMIVTVNLAKGAMAMSRKKVIVKRLNSIQNLGAMNILCTDKTGTLTQDKVILERYVDVLGNTSSKRVIHFAYLNSFYQTGLKSLLDRAILTHAEIEGELLPEANYRKVDEIPFDFSRKRMSVIIQTQNKHNILICKGAIEEVFALCDFADIDGKQVPIAEISKETCYQLAQNLNDDGLRVIAVAYREFPLDRSDFHVADENKMTLLGFVAFLDPPKETAAQAIKGLSHYGVKVKVLTGDNERVAINICRQVGISTTLSLLGSDIDQFTDAELDARVDDCALYAKLTPAQKERIIRSLHRRGHVVGFLGDGINDAPALRAADVGISVDNAVDVAKESADIILLEKSLLVLESGVIEGRKIFGNILKYIRMGASSNFGNVLSVLGASWFLPFLPMLPVQLLAQNLLYDISQTALPFDDVDDEYVNAPRRWDIANIFRFMVVFGPISSLFDYVTFGVMWYVFKANSHETQSFFHTGWFIEGLLSQTLIVHLIRTNKIPFVQSRASLPLIVMTALVMGAGILIPFTSFGNSIGLVPLEKNYFYWLIGILVAYCVLTQFVKVQFTKKYGYH